MEDSHSYTSIGSPSRRPPIGTSDTIRAFLTRPQNRLSRSGRPRVTQHRVRAGVVRVTGCPMSPWASPPVLRDSPGRAQPAQRGESDSGYSEALSRGLPPPSASMSRRTRARGCLVTMRPSGPAAGSLALPALALAPAGIGTDGVRPVEHAWGRAPEPALHRLLRDDEPQARSRHRRGIRCPAARRRGARRNPELVRAPAPERAGEPRARARGGRARRPAALAWLDRHGGSAEPAGRFGAHDARPGARRRSVVPVPAVPPTPVPPWVSAPAERAVEAVVLAVAREGYRIGASCPVGAWRRGWDGYAEMGAIA